MVLLRAASGHGPPKVGAPAAPPNTTSDMQRRQGEGAGGWGGGSKPCAAHLRRLLDIRMSVLSSSAGLNAGAPNVRPVGAGLVKVKSSVPPIAESARIRAELSRRRRLPRLPSSGLSLRLLLVRVPASPPSGLRSRLSRLVVATSVRQL
eukprot:SAG22_NODE_77_length_22125_cov_46.140016_3_plen_149_part_00